MLAIKALLQDQKDAKGGEHHDPTEEILRDTSGQEISNTAKKSLASDVDKSDTTATVRINSQNGTPLNPPASESKRQLRDLESSAYMPAVQSPGSSPGTTNHRRYQPREDNPDFQVRPRGRVVRPNLPEPKLRIGYHLFLLKPVVENFFDKVELTWLLQNIQMPESSIPRYLNQQDYERNYVFDRLHELHPYEKKILDGVIFGIDTSTEGSLLSLQRTKTTIRHRDITFTDVPGLQFVVFREHQIPDEVTRIVPPPPLSPSERMWHQRELQRIRVDPAKGQGHASHDASYPIRERFRCGRARRAVGASSQLGQDDLVDEDEQPIIRRDGYRSRGAIESDEDRYAQARHRRHAIRSSDSTDSEDQGFGNEADQEPVSLPEQDADAVIDDMLKRYTTLFD